jgi:hypothetical protein
MAASRLRLQIGQGESDRRARTPAALPDGVCECWTLAATPSDQWLAAVHLLTVACDGDHDRRFGHFLPERRGNLIPVQTGQAKIEQHFTRLLTVSNFDAIASSVGSGLRVRTTCRTQNRVLAERGDHDGVMPFPPLEIVNTVVPWSAAPGGPVTPLRTVIWPPVLNACLPANLIVTTSLQ